MSTKTVLFHSDQIRLADALVEEKGDEPYRSLTLHRPATLDRIGHYAVVVRRSDKEPGTCMALASDSAIAYAPLPDGKREWRLDGLTRDGARRVADKWIARLREAADAEWEAYADYAASVRAARV